MEDPKDLKDNLTYVTIITCDIFPKDVYKIVISSQLEKQIIKKYQKYYPCDIQIIKTILLSKNRLNDIKPHMKLDTKDFYHGPIVKFLELFEGGCKADPRNASALRLPCNAIPGLE